MILKYIIEENTTSKKWFELESVHYSEFLRELTLLF
jgi:hypothetical protein